ncbi:Nn.00g000020.m01.CDS01 [Neocucurbitaria sp. VM-36]
MGRESGLSESALAEIAVPWNLPPPPRYVFTGANLIDPVQGIVVKDATIHLFGGTVVSVNGNSDEWVNDPNVIKVELQGRYVCPGLTDCHVHLAAVPGEKNLQDLRNISPSTALLRQPQLLRSMLERGFTTVRDCGGASIALKKAVEENVHPGPRMYIAGHALSQTGGHGDMRQMHDDHECCAGTVLGISRIFDGVPACLKYAREELRQGSDFLKIMGGGGVASPTDKIEHIQFSNEEIRAIVTVATNAGTYVTSHAYTPQAIQQAVKQGVKGIEHGNLLDEATAKLMAEKDVYLTPTLVTYATMTKFSNFLSPASAKKNAEVLKQGLHALEIAQKAGVTICFGTDLLGPLHYNQSREFGLRSKVQTPLEIIRSATINPARMLRQEKVLGQVAPGFAADLLILKANPLEDISILDEPEMNLLATLKDGRVVASRWSVLRLDKKRLPKLT